jgi:hypothetical protein
MFFPSLRIVWLGLVLMLCLSFYPLRVEAAPNPEQLGKAVAEIEALDQMRSSLASGLAGQTEPPNPETFKQVCRPVGMRAQQLSQENGWQVQQLASKYRNPAHEAKDFQALMGLAQFEQNPDLTGFWQEQMLAGQTGTRYFRRINVEPSCLACHGAKGVRPAFIQNKYPQDLAYDFQPGDLRGLYSVFIPYLAPSNPE